MGKLIKGALAAVGLAAVAAGAESAYFYNRTMKRSKAKVEDTIKMSGTDWEQYYPFIDERKAKLANREREDVYITSNDGLKLHGLYFPEGDEKKIAICFHGYTSNCTQDYMAMSDYFLRNGFSLLLVDERAHGESEGEYIGFGCLDRHDALGWINYIIGRCGEDVQILLHGTSMGGATVLMASGLDLPKQVRGIISDCGFTSPKYVFTHVLNSMYHLPAFPVIPITNEVNLWKAGYGMDECNSAREVRKAKVPALLVHGDKDFFVPCSMCDEIYENYAAPVTKLIVSGASHAESYYKDTAAYEAAMDMFIEENFD